MVNLGSLKYRYNIPLIYVYTDFIILDTLYWDTHCRVHLPQKRVINLHWRFLDGRLHFLLALQTEVHFGLAFFETWVLQCLHKGPGIRNWFPLFSLFFTQKSLSPHWIVFYFKSSKQDFNVCKHWLQILSIIWVPCSLQPPRAKLTSKISPPINHVNQTPLFISIQVYLSISGNQFIRWLIRHYIPTICYTAQLINVATAPTYLECYANCIARVSSVTKAFLQFFMCTLDSPNWENFEKKHFCQS